MQFVDMQHVSGIAHLLFRDAIRAIGEMSDRTENAVQSMLLLKKPGQSQLSRTFAPRT